ncbi:unnamed protein product [Vitrella brassicaformis CCMP3155]|uniref:Protein kinase domain-containing protein n=1 Tax=Vitrella brassicaformis (strain CCMP3155) TaxID=1169540 RepID=A0A0G4EKR4_VITBC|nr:unnamed protein product [Vitrella brassicaformis CCMP3155]|eukprot:CEL97039.1 unnamed protein product [Vitrella brassicaformis CCMP3155]
MAAFKHVKNIEEYYTVGGEVAKSSRSAVVLRATCRKTGEEMIIKKIDKESIGALGFTKESHLRDVYEALASNRSPNLVDIEALLEDDEHIYIVMEKLRGPTLQDWQKRMGHTEVLSNERIREVMKQVLSAVQNLHTHNIVHRDVKLSNFVFAGKDAMRLKMIDFDVCMFLDRPLPKVDGKPKIIGTRAFMAPECYAGQYTPQTDVWAAGVVFYHILCQEMPFDVSVRQTFAQSKAALQRETLFSDSESAYMKEEADLASRMLAYDPRYRMPTAADALDHPFLATPLPAKKENEPTVADAETGCVSTRANSTEALSDDSIQEALEENLRLRQEKMKWISERSELIAKVDSLERKIKANLLPPHDGRRKREGKAEVIDDKNASRSGAQKRERIPVLKTNRPAPTRPQQLRRFDLSHGKTTAAKPTRLCGRTPGIRQGTREALTKSPVGGESSHAPAEKAISRQATKATKAISKESAKTSSAPQVAPAPPKAKVAGNANRIPSQAAANASRLRVTRPASLPFNQESRRQPNPSVESPAACAPASRQMAKHPSAEAKRTSRQAFQAVARRLTASSRAAAGRTGSAES